MREIHVQCRHCHQPGCAHCPDCGACPGQECPYWCEPDEDDTPADPDAAYRASYRASDGL